MSPESGYGVESLKITRPSCSSSSDFERQPPIGIKSSVHGTHIDIVWREADLPFVVACRNITDLQARPEEGRKEENISR